MFDELSSKLTDTLRRLTGRGALSEEAVREGLREIRRILLEADVSFELTGEFLARVQAAAVGQEINTAYERMLKSDVKYRFVIEMGSIK